MLLLSHYAIMALFLFGCPSCLSYHQLLNSIDWPTVTSQAGSKIQTYISIIFLLPSSLFTKSLTPHSFCTITSLTWHLESSVRDIDEVRASLRGSVRYSISKTCRNNVVLYGLARWGGYVQSQLCFASLIADNCKRENIMSARPDKETCRI